MNTTIIQNIDQLPLLMAIPNLSVEEFTDWYQQNKEELADKLLKYGAIKISGVQIPSADAFGRITDVIASKFMAYIDGNSPRTKLSGNIYTSTEYDQTQKITMHNELSYSARWPRKLFFTCIKPAATGGETLLADSREILRQMSPAIIDRISDGVVYIRNLHGGEGIGPSWQHTFETDDPGQLEDCCRAYSIDYEWKADGGVRLKQAGPGILRHPITGEQVWFNQVDQFHPCQLGEELYEACQMIYDSPEEFPTYVTFKDGTKIEDSIIYEILQTISRVTVAPVWKKDELLIVDNELVSHGRNPFTGDRKVLVTMSE